MVSRRLLAGLATETPVLADAAGMAHLDIDSAQRRVYGHAKQGAGFGAAKVGGYTLRLRGLNPLLAAVSTPTCAPVLVGTLSGSRMQLPWLTCGFRLRARTR